jgi:hypothetical protein
VDAFDVGLAHGIPVGAIVGQLVFGFYVFGYDVVGINEGFEYR